MGFALLATVYEVYITDMCDVFDFYSGQVEREGRDSGPILLWLSVCYRGIPPSQVSEVLFYDF